MKAINLYINESLVKSKPIGNFDKRIYHPKTKEELEEAIKTELESGNTDLNCIDTSEITDMSYLFNDELGININKYGGNIDVSEWKVNNVENMIGMFSGCVDFNCDLSKWDMHNVMSTAHMFVVCKKFNCDLSNWDVSNVTFMRHMFDGCENFNCDLSKWTLPKKNGKNIYGMFENCPLSNIYGATPTVQNNKLIQ